MLLQWPSANNNDEQRPRTLRPPALASYYFFESDSSSRNGNGTWFATAIASVQRDSTVRWSLKFCSLLLSSSWLVVDDDALDICRMNASTAICLWLRRAWAVSMRLPHCHLRHIKVRYEFVLWCAAVHSRVWCFCCRLFDFYCTLSMSVSVSVYSLFLSICILLFFWQLLGFGFSSVQVDYFAFTVCLGLNNNSSSLTSMNTVSLSLFSVHSCTLIFLWFIQLFTFCLPNLDFTHVCLAMYVLQLHLA